MKFKVGDQVIHKPSQAVGYVDNIIEFDTKTVYSIDFIDGLLHGFISWVYAEENDLELK